MIKFMALNDIVLVISGMIFVIVGVLISIIKPSLKKKSGGCIMIIVGLILLSTMFIMRFFSKEFMIIKIIEQKPNLKKEYLMKYDRQFLRNISVELMEKELKEIQEKKEKEIQEIINS